MSLKSKSNLYGHGPNGMPSKHINYQYARKFNPSTLKKHYNEHGEDLNCNSKEELENKAIRFANSVDRRHCESYVRKNGDTVKFNKKTGEICVITKDGIINTYFIPKKPKQYYNNDKSKHKRRKKK